MSYLQQSVLRFLRTGLQRLGGVDDGDGHEADGEVPDAQQTEDSFLQLAHIREEPKERRLVLKCDFIRLPLEFHTLTNVPMADVRIACG